MATAIARLGPALKALAIPALFFAALLGPASAGAQVVVTVNGYAYLDARSAASAISSNARRVLQADLAASRAAFDAGNYTLARTRLDTYIDDVRRYGGKGVPNKWRAKRDLDNIAGDLIGAAAALQYTLSRL